MITFPEIGSSILDCESEYWNDQACYLVHDGNRYFIKMTFFQGIKAMRYLIVYGTTSFIAPFIHPGAMWFIANPCGTSCLVYHDKKKNKVL